MEVARKVVMEREIVFGGRWGARKKGRSDVGRTR